LTPARSPTARPPPADFGITITRFSLKTWLITDTIKAYCRTYDIFFYDTALYSFLVNADINKRSLIFIENKLIHLNIDGSGNSHTKIFLKNTNVSKYFLHNISLLITHKTIQTIWYVCVMDEHKSTKVSRQKSKHAVV